MFYLKNKLKRCFGCYCHVIMNSTIGSGGSSSENISTGDKTPGGHSFSKHGAERANERGFLRKKLTP